MEETLRGLFFFGLLACLAPLSQASLIGTTVTGVMNVAGDPTDNWYDPANGFVPTTGYQNSASNSNSPTVTIVGGNEFGYNDGFNLDVTSFGAGGFMVTDSVESGGSNIAMTFTFTDTAFSGAGISEVSSTFSGLTYGIAGDVITVNIPAADVTAGNTLSASFVLTPEPSSFALLASGLIGAFVLAGLRKRSTPARR
jgi:hypothetical protein